MELIKRCHSSSPQTLPFPIAATVVVAVFTRWALRIELQAPRVRERGFRCLLPSSALYDRPYPVFHPLSSLLLVPRCSRRQPLPNPRLVLRNYRRISANTADEYLEDRILQGRGLEKEYWKGGGYIYIHVYVGRDWGRAVPPAGWRHWKLRQTRPKTGLRDERFLERREEGRGGEEMYLPRSLGSNRPSEQSRAYRRVDNSGHNVKVSPTE